MDRTFYLDIKSIKTNLVAWRNNFSWPVPDTEWLHLNSFAFDQYDIALASVDRVARDLLLTDFRFLNLLLGHLQILRVMQFIKKNEMNALGSDPYLSIDWENQGRIYDSLPKNNIPQKVRGLSKNIILNSKFGLKGVKAWFPRTNTSAIALGSRSWLMAEYLEQRGEPVFHMNPGEVLNICAPLNTQASQVAQNILRNVIQEARAMWDIEPHYERIAFSWINRLESLAGQYDHILRSYTFPETVYATNVAQPFIKLICLAARQQRAKAIGFSHGHDIKATISRTFCYNEAPQFDRFIYPTEAATANAVDNYNMSSIKKYYPVDFISAQSKYYEQLIENNYANSLPEKISTIMLMGFPLNSYHYLEEFAGFSQFHLELGLRLVEFLKKRGYDVIYKGHPDRKYEALGMFDGIADEILFTPFENIWQRADAFLFTYSGTTTFGFALCCDRPVILLDHVDRQWNKKAYDLISKRCRMVVCKPDERQRLIFSRKDLEYALRPPSRLNMDFVRYYFLGDDQI